MYETFADRDLEAYFVITSDSNGDPPTASTCDSLRRQFGLSMTVLIDPAGRMAETLAAASYDYDIVLERGAVIHFKDSSSTREVTEILDQLLPAAAGSGAVP